MAKKKRNKRDSPAAGQRLLSVRSELTHVAWPALGSPNTNVVFAFLFQQQLSQWWRAQALGDAALRQLQAVVAGAYAAPFYREMFDNAGIVEGDVLTATAWQRLPLAGREQLDAFARAGAVEVPQTHGGDVSIVWRDGSRNPALVRSALTAFFDATARLRELQWHRRDPGATVVVVDRAGPGAATSVSGRDGWDTALGCVGANSRRESVDESLGAGAVVETLQRTRAEYLECSAAALAALVEHCRGRVAPALRLIRIHDVPPAPELIEAAACFGAAVHYHFATPLTGAVAFECAEAGSLHVQAEQVYTELVDPSGAWVPRGERGALVVTDLHNLRQPVLRCVTGWSARWSDCACGRGLPVLADLAPDRS